MVLLLLAAAGFVAGAYTSLRYSRALREAKDRLPTAPLKMIARDSGRALIIGQAVVRAQLCRAFLSTARCVGVTFGQFAVPAVFAMTLFQRPKPWLTDGQTFSVFFLYDTLNGFFWISIE
jgi:hypothetical protein